MIPFITFLSIVVVYAVLAFAMAHSVRVRNLVPCAACVAVVITWFGLLSGRLFGAAALTGDETLLVLMLLMGGSVAGFSTQAMKLVKARASQGAGLVRAAIVLIGMPTVFTFLTGRWGWFTFMILVGLIATAIIAPFVRRASGGPAAESFLVKLDHCCDK